MDYDGDGDLDILSGSYTGEVYLFVRKADGSLTQGVFLRNAEGSPLQVGTSITPEAHDLDGDGDLDLLIGTRLDGVFMHENVGTRTEPRIAAKGTPWKTENGEKILGSNAHYADWDHDGVRDLVLGSEWGDVVWHRNLGRDTAPRFAGAVTLLDIRSQGSPRVQRGKAPPHPGSRTKLHVTDWNGDGKLDLLVGDVRWHDYSETPLSQGEAKTKDELQPEYDRLLERYIALSRERAQLMKRNEPVPQGIEREYLEVEAAFDQVRKQMRAFNRVKSETHGYVWLYLRDGGGGGQAAPLRSERSQGNSASLRTEAKAQGDGDTFGVTLRLTVDAGWHAYALAPKGSGNRVVTPSLRLPDGFQQVGGFKAEGRAIPATDGSGGLWYVGEIRFRTTVRREPGQRGAIMGVVSLQICNEQLCLPPEALTAGLDL